MTCLFKCHFSFSTMMTGVLLLLLMLQFSGITLARESALQLSSDTETATAGFFRLSWESADGDPVVELQQADNPAFADASFRYRGPDRASVISGMPDGSWYYRVRTVADGGTSPWSDAVMVKVAHHPLSRAFLFFGLGVLVFLATVLLIIRGAVQAR